MFAERCRLATISSLPSSPSDTHTLYCNKSPRKQSGLLRRAAPQSYAARLGRHQELIRLLSKRAEEGGRRKEGWEALSWRERLYSQEHGVGRGWGGGRKKLDPDYVCVCVGGGGGGRVVGGSM